MQTGQRVTLCPSTLPIRNKTTPVSFLRLCRSTLFARWHWSLQARHTLFVFDSCFSGSIFISRSSGDVPPAVSHDTPAYFQRLSQHNVQFLTAGSAHERVPSHSLFMAAFISALNGDEQADLDHDGVITANELGFWMRNSVNLPRQTPQFGSVGDFGEDGQYVVATNVHRPDAVNTSTPNSQSADADDDVWSQISDDALPERSTLTAYLTIFPSGHHAEQARRWLREPTGPEHIAGPDTPQACDGREDDAVVYFEWDRANLNQAAVETLDAMVARLPNPSWVRVDGYTDTSTAPGYALELTERQARVVSSGLVARGYPSSIITGTAHGGTDLARPTVLGVREPLNRRVAITICSVAK